MIAIEYVIVVVVSIAFLALCAVACWGFIYDVTHGDDHDRTDH